MERKAKPRPAQYCMIGVPAELYEYGAPETVTLELYLMELARDG